MSFKSQQLKYMGGGHPGCGGYCEALRIETPNGHRFVLHQYISDQAPGVPPCRSRWQEFASEEILLAAWKWAWNLCKTGEGFGEWSDSRWWEGDEEPGARDNLFSMYALFDRPNDFPNECIVRQHEICEGAIIAGPIIGRGATVDEARQFVPDGLSRIPRSKSDVKSLVETWV